MKTSLPNCFISSVGTSIIENSDKEFTNIVDSDKDLETFKERCFQDNQLRSQYLDRYVQIVIDNSGLSAEIDALKRDIQPHDRIILLSSKTDKAFFCAHALKTYFVNYHNIQDIEIIIVEGLREPDDTEFQERGLPDFLNVLIQSIENHKDRYQIVLNPTGGYKSLFPLMTLVGIIYEIPVIYTFEKTDHIIKIPPLPLHVHLPAWTQMESLIQLLNQKTDFHDNTIYQNNKHQFGLMLYEKNGKLQASALSNAFSTHATIERGQPELIVRTKNSPLINFLKSDQREIFLRLTEIGHLIWKGDRVPEMADHALKHHSDLFHLAERVLLPIFYDKPDFLASHELFILLCGLYLHDCGHVIDRIQQSDGTFYPLFPLEIRDHHHVLGYLRLKYPEIPFYMGDVLYDHICQTDSDDPDRSTKWKKAWERYLNVIAMVGLYHRKKMFLEVPNTYKFVDTCSDNTFKSLKETFQEHPIQIFDKNIDFERMKLIIALLRIIDSLDEQASRTGSIADIQFHLAQLNIDARIEKDRMDKIATNIEDDLLEKINEIMKAYINGFINKEDKRSESQERQVLDTPEFRKKIQSLISENDKHSFLLFEYANAYLKEFFKKFQIKPYGEKAYISGIDIQSLSENGTITLVIDLQVENKPKHISKLQKLFQVDDLTAHKNNILKSIAKEYSNTEKNENINEEFPIIRETLEKNNICFKYRTSGGLS